jgi:hypothetical protein
LDFSHQGYVYLRHIASSHNPNSGCARRRVRDLYWDTFEYHKVKNAWSRSMISSFSLGLFNDIMFLFQQISGTWYHHGDSGKISCFFLMNSLRLIGIIMKKKHDIFSRSWPKKWKNNWFSDISKLTIMGWLHVHSHRNRLAISVTVPPPPVARYQHV